MKNKKNGASPRFFIIVLKPHIFYNCLESTGMWVLGLKKSHTTSVYRYIVIRIYAAHFSAPAIVPPHSVGEPSAIPQVYPKAGGVIMLYDFLNSPTTKSLVVFCLPNKELENEKNNNSVRCIHPGNRGMPRGRGYQHLLPWRPFYRMHIKIHKCLRHRKPELS